MGSNDERSFYWLTWLVLPALAALVVYMFLPAGSSRTDVAAWRRALQDPRTRFQTIDQLARDRRLDALPELNALAFDAEPRTREAAIRALGELGAPGGHAAVAEHAGDVDLDVRLAVARSLGQLFQPGSADAFGMLLDDHERAVRGAAVEALAPHAEGDAAARCLLSALDDEDAAIRLRAIELLVHANRAVATAALARALADPHPQVRQVARDAAPAFWEDLLPHLRGELVDAPSLRARLEAAKLLAATGDPSVAPLLIHMLEDAGGPRSHGHDPQAPAIDPELRGQVIEALVSMGPDIAEPLAATVIDEECSPAVEAAAAEVCRRLGPPAAKPIAQALLRWRFFPNPQELELWVEVLGEIGDNDAAEALDHAAAQQLGGLQSVIEQARAEIAKRTGSPLAAGETTDHPLTGPPGEAAFTPLGATDVRITPRESSAASLPDDGVVRLDLEDALLVHQSSGAVSRRPLTIEFIRRDGRWQHECRGYAHRFNKRDHPAFVEATRQGNTITLAIKMYVLADYWVEGGYGEYQVTLRRESDTWRAAYEGRYNYQPVRGDAAVDAWPLDASVTQVDAPSGGEHPRCYFRRWHMDALRERARTRLGRAIIDNIRHRLARSKRLYQQDVDWVRNWQSGMDAAIGHGFFYTLFGDELHGRRAVALVLKRSRIPPYAGEHGERLPAPLAFYPFGYDMCYGAMTERERREINNDLARFGGMVIAQKGLTGVLAGGSPPGNWGPPGGAAVAMLGEQGPLGLVEPQPPTRVITLQPTRQDDASDQAPSNAYTPGRLLKQWQLLGPWPLVEAPGADGVVAALVGAREVIAGKPIAIDDREVAVRVLPEKPREASGFGGKLTYLTIPGATDASRGYLYGALDVREEAGCRLAFDVFFSDRSSRVWIDGVQIRPDELIILKPGRHVVVAEINGRYARPMFARADAHAAKGAATRHDFLHEQWREAVERHEATGIRQDIPHALAQCRTGIRTWLYHRGEDAIRASRMNHRATQWPFVHAAWMSFGQPLEPDTPLAIHVLREQVERGRLTFGSRQLCFTMGMVPDDLRLAYAREFNRRYMPDKLDQLAILELVAVYVNYPFDLLRDEQTPRH